MNINYITYDSWWDTDKTILPDLCKEHCIRCFVLNPQMSERKFDTKEICGLDSLNQIEFPYRDRDIRTFFKTFSYFRTINKNIRNKDFVNIYVPGKNPLFLLLFLLFAPCERTIICIHNFQEHSGGRFSNITEKIKMLYYKHFDFFLFYSRRQLSKFSESYNNKAGFCLEMPLKDFGSPVHLNKSDKVRFLFFGLIKEYKNLKLFIQAANLIEDNRAEFFIAGNCNNWDEYKKLIVNKNIITDIRFIRNEEIPSIFCASDFLVLPYKDATQSGPLLTALNYGLPVIASDIEEFKPYITHGVNGFLFENGNDKALGDLFNKVICMSAEDRINIKQQQLLERERYKEKCDINESFNSIFKKINFF